MNNEGDMKLKDKQRRKNIRFVFEKKSSKLDESLLTPTTPVRTN